MSLWDASGPLKAVEFAPDFPDHVVVVCRVPHLGVEFLLTVPKSKFTGGEVPLHVQALALDATVTLRGVAA